MRKQLVIIFTAIFMAIAISLIGGGTKTTQAQGLVEYALLQVDGTLGDNGIYVSDVTYSWVLPDGSIPESIVGCESGIITQDTPVDGIYLLCSGQTGSGSYFQGAILVDGQIQPPIIYRDTAPPQLTLVSPNTPNVKAAEGSSLYLKAIAQDVYPVKVGWDLNEDGTIDAPNPTSVTIPGLQGMDAPYFIVTAKDAAGNVSQMEVKVSIINLPPNIDSLVVPSTIHYGGTLQLTASASDPGNDPLKAHVAWGDGQLGLVVVMPDGSLQAEHTYKGYGTFLVTLTLSDDEGLSVSDSRSVMVESPIQTIENLKTGTQADCKKYNFIDGECGSLLVKLDETVNALNYDRPSAPQKLNAYLNEFEAVVPNGITAPDFLVATDVRDALILNGWVPDPPP